MWFPNHWRNMGKSWNMEKNPHFLEKWNMETMKSWWHVVDLGWTPAKDSYCDMIDHAALEVSGDSGDGGDFLSRRNIKPTCLSGEIRLKHGEIWWSDRGWAPRKDFFSGEMIPWWTFFMVMVKSWCNETTWWTADAMILMIHFMMETSWKNDCMIVR